MFRFFFSGFNFLVSSLLEKVKGISKDDLPNAIDAKCNENCMIEESFLVENFFTSRNKKYSKTKTILAPFKIL